MTHVLLVQSDARQIPLADKSVHCCVTSPPYWSLRSYDGITPDIWGGNPDCRHAWGDPILNNATNHTDKRRWQHTRNGHEEEQPIEKRVAWLRTKVPQGTLCQKCGAWQGCLGLEPLHDCQAWACEEPPCAVCYVCHMRTIFAESLTDYGQRGTDSTYQHVPNGGDNAGLGAFARRIRQARLTGNRTLTKNSRDVWAICSEPTPEAHFATMPSELAKRCILAGTSANADPSPAIVLDPFAGSGTTGMTAWGLGRSAVLCDLSLPYLRMIAKERLGFAAWTADDGTPTMPPDEAWHQLSLIS